LLIYAEWDFKLSLPDKNGVSEREHLEQVEKQIGKTPVPLQSPDYPHLIDHVWQAFLALHRTRASGVAGPTPIKYSDISLWQTLTGNQLSIWEVELLTKIDSKYMRVINDRPS